MPRRKDIWRCGLLTLPVGEVLAGGLSHAPVHWLPEAPRFGFLADPFAWRGRGHLHIFAERYDYATRHGTIDLLTLDDGFRVIDQHPCLREEWHLSYPQVFDADGATWMLPEAYRSGGLHLYRMGDGPADWAREVEIRLDCVPVDATPLWHDGRWWLFYCKRSFLGTLRPGPRHDGARLGQAAWVLAKLNGSRSLMSASVARCGSSART